MLKELSLFEAAKIKLFPELFLSILQFIFLISNQN
jgi:hypothetical protein